MIATTVGSYRILEKIGEGGVGEVFRATDTVLGRCVALKALRAELAAEPKLLARFRSEAQTLAQLNHPNIATLYNLIEADDRHYMVMEYVEGQTFSAMIESTGGLAPECALPLFFQALDGIGYAHERGIVHRDIKGANLMLTGRDTVKVMDFGIARALGSDRLTKHGHMVGTLESMSPEQVRGGESDARSDIYALGIVLYAMLTGRVPFEADSEYGLMRAHVEQPPPSPRRFAAHLSEPVEQAILRALAKHPAERFPSTGAFRAALVAGCPAGALAEHPSISLHAAIAKPAMADADEIPTTERTALPPAGIGAAPCARPAAHDSASQSVSDRSRARQVLEAASAIAAVATLVLLVVAANVLLVESVSAPSAKTANVAFARLPKTAVAIDSAAPDRKSPMAHFTQTPPAVAPASRGRGSAIPESIGSGSHPPAAPAAPPSRNTIEARAAKPEPAAPMEPATASSKREEGAPGWRIRRE